MTIDLFNKLTGRETLHPLISIIDLSNANLNRDIRMTCDFYGLLYYVTLDGNQYSGKDKLRLIHPGELVEIPSLEHRSTNGYTGIIFHPDLLYETSLEGRIDSYPTRCRCRGPLSAHEQQVISDSLQRSGQNCIMPSTATAHRSSLRISSCYSITACAFVIRQTRHIYSYQ